MDLSKRFVKSAIIIIVALLSAAQCVQFEDETSASNQKIANISYENPQVEGRQSARHLFDYIGLSTGRQVDPFLRKTNEKCLNGELSECFKSQALNTFDDFFQRDSYV
jgi:hypothetical protein